MMRTKVQCNEMSQSKAFVYGYLFLKNLRVKHFYLITGYTLISDGLYLLSSILDECHISRIAQLSCWYTIRD